MPDVLDMEVVAELLSVTGDDDPELLLDLIEMFLEDAPEKAREIQTSLDSGDLDSLAEAAHSLKGSAGNLGAVQLQEDCDALQMAGRQQAADAARQRLASLDQHLAATLDALRGLQAKYR